MNHVFDAKINSCYFLNGKKNQTKNITGNAEISVGYTEGTI